MLKKKYFAYAITILVFVFSISILIFLTDYPLKNKHLNKNINLRCAIAIRDNVVPFQKWGTRLFTVPYLEKYYNKVFYFTQYSEIDKKQAFIDSLNLALQSFEIVDIYILAHGNLYYEWFYEADTSKFYKIRLVYNTGCTNFSQENIWKELGVKSYVAHFGDFSESPIFYFYFLRRWTSGYSLQDAVEKSNHLTEKFFDKIFFFNENKDECTKYKKDTHALISGNDSIKIE